MSSKSTNDYSVSQEEEEIVGQILRDLRSPDQLTQTAARWLDSCLYRQQFEKDPQRPPYQILKSIFTDVLDILAKENSESAEILQARFWEGLTAKEIFTKYSWGERSFYLQQKKAIKLFTFLLLQKENACSLAVDNMSPVDEKSSSLVGDYRKSNKRSTPMVLLGVAVSLAFLAAFIIFIIPSFPQSMPKTLTSSPATPTRLPSICGESERILAPQTSRFVRSQGVSNFTVENTAGGVISDRVRALAINPEGLWIGYFENGDQKGGVGQYNKATWGNCPINLEVERKNINALAVDQGGHVWVGFEKGGVGYFDGATWHLYTTQNGLPSNEIFAITIDDQNIVWVGTWEGIGRFDGQWSAPYTVKNNTIYNDHVDAIAFDEEKNIWVGHIRDGVSEYRLSDGKWISYRAGAGELGGDEVRSIVIKHRTEKEPESVWFATAGGGISRFENGQWTIYHTEDGLPSNEVTGLAVDRYNRIWAATAGGVVYYDGYTWMLYNTINTFSIAIGPACPNQKCIFDDDQIWTGTVGMGLTHSRLPLPEPVLDVMSICFVNSQREKVCPELSAVTVTNAPVITTTYPITLTPGNSLRFEVTVSTRFPYQLREDRGDFLSNTDKEDFNLFKAWPVIGVKGTLEPGQPYTFTDYDNPFVAPVPKESVETYVSTWRIWMYTRFVGPYIKMIFTVKK